MSRERQTELEIEREWKELQRQERLHPTAASLGIVPESGIKKLWSWLRSLFWR
jgi:hypothetical protein